MLFRVRLSALSPIGIVSLDVRVETSDPGFAQDIALALAFAPKCDRAEALAVIDPETGAETPLDPATKPQPATLNPISRDLRRPL